MTNTNYQSIDEYMATLPKDVQIILEEVRRLIKTEVPDATEAISYQIPVFRMNGRNLIHFAAWKNHLSVYPIPKGDRSFKKLIEQYIAGKGTLKFSLAKPLPKKVIKSVVKLHVKRLTSTG